MIRPGTTAGHAGMCHRKGEKQPEDGGGSGDGREPVHGVLRACGHPDRRGDRGSRQSGTDEDAHDIAGAVGHGQRPAMAQLPRLTGGFPYLTPPLHGRTDPRPGRASGVRRADVARA